MKKVGLLLLAVLITSCGNDLSRSEAEDLITNYIRFKELGKKPRTNPQAKYNGQQQGYWDQNSNISNKGKYLFKKKGYNYLELKSPIQAKVTMINGIADTKSSFGNNKSFKEVQFTWRYTKMDDVTKRFIVTGGNGKGFMRKFDDGWRVDNISFSFSNQGFALTEADKANIKSDIEIEKKRLKEEQRLREIEMARRKAEQEKRNQLIAISKKSTKTLGTYDGVHNFTGRKLKQQVTLTDTTIYRPLPGNENNLNIWIGSIQKRPTAHQFKQTAMGWTGYVIKVDNSSITFKDQNEATRFYNNLNTAIDKWNAKYPSLKKIQNK